MPQDDSHLMSDIRKLQAENAEIFGTKSIETKEGVVTKSMFQEMREEQKKWNLEMMETLKSMQLTMINEMKNEQREYNEEMIRMIKQTMAEEKVEKEKEIEKLSIEIREMKEKQEEISEKMNFTDLTSGITEIRKNQELLDEKLSITTDHLHMIQEDISKTSENGKLEMMETLKSMQETIAVGMAEMNEKRRKELKYQKSVNEAISREFQSVQDDIDKLKIIQQLIMEGIKKSSEKQESANEKLSETAESLAAIQQKMSGYNQKKFNRKVIESLKSIKTQNSVNEKVFIKFQAIRADIDKLRRETTENHVELKKEIRNLIGDEEETDFS